MLNVLEVVCDFLVVCIIFSVCEFEGVLNNVICWIVLLGLLVMMDVVISVLWDLFLIFEKCLIVDEI